MISISAAAIAAIKAGAVVFAELDVLANFTAIAGPLSIDDGAKLTVDGTAAIVRTIDLNVADLTGILPLTPTSPLAPFGNELAAYSGVILPAGTAITNGLQTTMSDGRVLERWPVGVFVIDDPKLTDTASALTLTVRGFDRSYAVSQHRLPNTYTIAAGTPYVVAPASSGLRPTGAIADLIASVYPLPGYLWSFAATTATTPALVFNELDDPWKHAQDLAAAAGMRLYFDATGVLTLANIADPNAAVPVFDYAEGDGGLLEQVEQTLSSRISYSHAIVIAEPLDGSAPIRSDAYDTDPTSPTYYLGPFGDRPTMLRTPLITTQAQADNAAAALLLRSKGASQLVTMTAVPVTAHDAYDTVRLTRARSNLNGVPFLMEKFTVPLGPTGSMTADFRGRRL